MEIIQIPISRLQEYARISIGFWVDRELRVEPVQSGLGGLCLVESPVNPGYFKDYDALGPEEGPLNWPNHFNLQNWGIFLAQGGEEVRGGAAVAWNTPGVHMLEGRVDLAVLWDIRVQPEFRGQGAGAALLKHAEAWARERGCLQMKIETQNNNVPACRFYARMGYTLGLIHCYAYAAVPGCENETMLCWFKDLR